MSGLGTIRDAAPVELEQLTLAMEDRRPACRGDDRFTRDDLTDGARSRLAVICASCPILTACADYAAAAIPLAGYWAGRQHSDIDSLQEGLLR